MVNSCGGDAFVVAAARVSTSGEEALKWADAPAEDNYGLIKYLLKHRHGTPTEHSQLTFFVHAPAFVWWEWVRHRMASYNLESGRYKVLEPIFWVPRPDRKMTPAEGHKSARPKFDCVDTKTYDAVVYELSSAYQIAWDSYEYLIQRKVANEVARAVLPFAIYYSGWVTMNPRSLMNFLSLRTNDDRATFVSYPQAEIEEAARVVEQMFAEGWPLTYKAFNECGRVAP